MKIWFITFGSHSLYINAATRLATQAKSFNIFTNIIAYTGSYLLQDTFWNKHANFIRENSRGFGYWLWKSYLIQTTMNQMEDGDILMYLDCGCELDIREKEHLLFYLDSVKTDKIIGCDTFCLERAWNKQDVIELLDMTGSSHLSTSQHEAGALLFLICPETRTIVNQWYELSCTYHNIDDSPSILPNAPEFKEHRHDQSIFSLLTKKYNLFSKINMKEKCIKYVRNRTGISRIR
jgi:hypothetical protein